MAEGNEKDVVAVMRTPAGGALEPSAVESDIIQQATAAEAEAVERGRAVADLMDQLRLGIRRRPS